MLPPSKTEVLWVTGLVLLLTKLQFTKGTCVNDNDCADTQACLSSNTCQDPCINLTCYGQGVCTVVNHLPSCVYNEESKQPSNDGGSSLRPGSQTNQQHHHHYYYQQNNHHHYLAASTVTPSNQTQPKVGKKNYYMDINLKRNWFGALMYCHSRGWRLATVENAQENVDLLTYVQTTHPNINWFEFKSEFWIGATYLDGSKSWKWIATGELCKFYDWNKGQPSKGSQHCMSIWKFKWNDYYCNTEFWFVCEYSI